MKTFLLGIALLLVLVGCGGEKKETKVVHVNDGFVLVEGGTFAMGDSFGDGNRYEKPTHSVTLDSFYISKYEVTQKEFASIMEFNPSSFSGDNSPVERVTWYDAVMYANKLSEKEGLTPYYNIENVTKEGDKITEATVTIAGGKGYRLPTEAEWEYAARGGKQSKGYKYSGSDNIDEVAWTEENSKGTIHTVGEKKNNELGIYDMTGNIYEWCWDWYGDYTEESKTNPTGPLNGTDRVNRGGSLLGDAYYATVSFRWLFKPENGYFIIGFRLVRSY